MTHKPDSAQADPECDCVIPADAGIRRFGVAGRRP